jgi:hypothetical protein
MNELMVSLASQYPMVLAILSGIGLLRAINKPLFALARSFVQATESKSDDVALDKIEQSKVYKGICFLLDYLMSVKLQPPAKAEAPKSADPS